MAGTKFTQIYTLIDEASKTLDEIAQGYKEVNREVDKNVKANDKLTQAEKKLTDAQRVEVDRLKALKAARVVQDKQAKKVERAYDRLRMRYDETFRVEKKLADMTKTLTAVSNQQGWSAEKLAQKQAQLSEAIRNNTSATSRNIETQLTWEKIMQRGTFIMKTYIAGMAIRAINDFGRAIIDNSIALEKMQSTLRAVTGSQAGANDAMAFSAKLAKSLGLEVKTTTLAYSQFLAAATNSTLKDEAENIFSGFSKAITALRLGAGDAQGVFRALIQMISKGKVQAEELRGQLGERLPGAFQLAAESMNITTAQLNKMLEQGEVLAEDLLPRMAMALEDVYGAEAAKAVDGMVAKINEMKNAWFDFTNAAAAAGGKDIVDTLLSLATGTLNNVTKEFQLLTIVSALWEAQMVKLEGTIFGTTREIKNINEASLDLIGTRIKTLGGLVRDLDDDMKNGATAAQALERTELSAEYERLKVKLLELTGQQQENIALTEEQTKAAERAASAFQKLREDQDPLHDATVDYNLALKTINEALLQTELSQEAANEALAEADKAYGKAARSAMGYATEAQIAAQASRDLKTELSEIQREVGKEQREIAAQNREDERRAKERLSDLAKEQAFIKSEASKELAESKSNQAKEAAEEARIRAHSKQMLSEDIADSKTKGREEAKVQKKMLSGWEQYTNDVSSMHERVNSVALGAFQNMEDSIVNFVKTGKLEFESLVDDILTGLIRIAVQQSMVGFFGGAFGGGAGAAGTQGQSGGSFGTAMGSIFGFAQGGAFTVGGSGAVDSKLVAFRATPGERVSVQPSHMTGVQSLAQAGTAVAGGGGDVYVNIENNGAPADAQVTQTDQGPDKFISVVLSAVASDVVTNGVVGQAIDRSRGTNQIGVVR